jgi:recombination protein RecA
MNEKNKEIDEALKRLNKEFGAGSISEVKDRDAIDIVAMPTDCFSLDFVLACGGLPRGRILEVFGEESSGKSTLCLFLVSQVQKLSKGKCVWIDAECSFSSEYAKNVGVDTDNLILSQPTTGEEGLKMVREMINTKAIDLIVVDSVAALVPQKELAGELSDAEMAQQARMMSKALRVLAGEISKTKTVVIFINQLRDKIGVYWGNKHSTPGGKALKFYSSIRLEIKRSKKILEGKDNVIGNWMKVKAIKNKAGLPFREAEFELIYSKGVDLIGDLLDWAVKYGVVKKSGLTYVVNDSAGKEETKLGIGREAAKDVLSQSENILKYIKKELYAKSNEKKDNKKERIVEEDEEEDRGEESDD